ASMDRKRPRLGSRIALGAAAAARRPRPSSIVHARLLRFGTPIAPRHASCSAFARDYRSNVALRERALHGCIRSRRLGLLVDGAGDTMRPRATKRAWCLLCHAGATSITLAAAGASPRTEDQLNAVTKEKLIE